MHTREQNDPLYVYCFIFHQTTMDSSSSTGVKVPVTTKSKPVFKMNWLYALPYSAWRSAQISVAGLSGLLLRDPNAYKIQKNAYSS